MGQPTDLDHLGLVVIVIGEHDRDGVFGPRPAAGPDGREQDQHFFLHVHLQRPDQPFQQGAQPERSVRAVAMHPLDLQRQRGKVGQLRAVGLMIALAISAGLALVIGANWRLVDLAFWSEPGCVAERPGQPAAKPGC